MQLHHEGLQERYYFFKPFWGGVCFRLCLLHFGSAYLIRSYFSSFLQFLSFYFELVGLSIALLSFIVRGEFG